MSKHYDNTYTNVKRQMLEANQKMKDESKIKNVDRKEIRDYSYYSRVLEKPFDSIEELKAEEAKYFEAQRAKEDKAAAKKADAKKVEDAFITLNAARKEYKTALAAAAEASASTGGQIMPPIMGAAAFLMSDYVGVPYSNIVVRAILPAVLYFAGIFISILPVAVLFIVFNKEIMENVSIGGMKG